MGLGSTQSNLAAVEELRLGPTMPPAGRGRLPPDADVGDCQVPLQGPCAPGGGPKCTAQRGLTPVGLGMTTTLMTTISTDGTARTRTPTSTPAREREMLAFFPETGLSDLKPGIVGPHGRIPPARRPRTTRPRTTLRTTRRTARTAFSPPARAKEMLAFFPEAGLSDLKPGTVGPDGRIPPAR